MSDDEKLAAELEQVSEKALPELERRFAAGDKRALLEAVLHCMVGRGRKAPIWVRLAFANAYTDVTYYAKFGSWDDVFGKPWPKGHREQAQRRAKLRLYVWQRIRELHDHHARGIDNNLFEEVGEEFGVGGRQAKEMYYRVEKRLPPKDRAMARNR